MRRAALLLAWTLSADVGLAGEAVLATVEGSAESRFMPERLRLQTAVVAAGSDYAQASTHLAQQRERLSNRLRGLGALAAGLTFDDVESWRPSAAPADPFAPSLPHEPRLAPPQSLLPPKDSKAKGALAPAARPPAHVLLFQKVHADFPARATPAESQLYAEELLRALETEDLRGNRKLLEAGLCPTCGPSPVSLSFSVVAMVEEGQLDALFRSALESARTQAGQLGRAAGLRLGPLVSVTGPKRNVEGPANPRAQTADGPSATPARLEIASRGLGRVTHRVSITAVFALTP